MFVPAAMRALRASLVAVRLPFMAFIVFECDPYMGAPYVVISELQFSHIYFYLMSPKR
jgi:hypothetical protein